MKNLPIILGLLAFCISACKSQKNPAKAPDFTRFRNERGLSEENLFKVDDTHTDGMLLYRNSILLLRNAHNPANFFTVCSIRDKKLMGSLLPAGRKKNQSMGFLSYGIYRDKLWVYDIVKEKLLTLALNQGWQDTTSASENKLPFYYSMQIINDSTVAASGDYDSDFKLSLLDINTSRTKQQLIPYSNRDTRMLAREQKMAYEGFLFVQPSGNKAVLASRYADRVEIMDLVSNTSKILRGPEGYEPDVLVSAGNDGKQLSTRNENTRYAFVRGKTTEDFIYLLYSGNNNRTEHLDHGTYLFVYSWDGQPLEKLKFRDEVIDFAVSSDNKKIYAYHPSDKYITVSNHIEK